MTECIAYLDKGNLIIVNNSDEELKVSRVNVEYVIIGFKWEPTLHGREVKRVRRKVSEILSVSLSIPPKSKAKLYFGEVNELLKVSLQVVKEGKSYVYECKVTEAT